MPPPAPFPSRESYSQHAIYSFSVAATVRIEDLSRSSPRFEGLMKHRNRYRVQLVKEKHINNNKKNTRSH